MKFPTKSIEGVNQDPRKFLLLAQTKIGKTELCSKLPNSLMIDLDDSADFYGGMFMNISDIRKELSKEKGKEITNLQAYVYVVNKLKEAVINEEVSYDYLVLDNTTRLEDLAKDLALIKYKATPMGKSFTGTDIYTLDRGAGYGWVRNAFSELYDMLLGCYNRGLILIAHVKDASVIKDGKEVTAQDINLTGKLSIITAADMDAIGIMHRAKDGNNNILSFKTTERNVSLGSRCAHLSNTEFIISTKNEDGTLSTNWELVYQNLK